MKDCTNVVFGKKYAQGCTNKEVILRKEKFTFKVSIFSTIILILILLMAENVEVGRP